MKITRITTPMPRLVTKEEPGCLKRSYTLALRLGGWGVCDSVMSAPFLRGDLARHGLPHERFRVRLRPPSLGGRAARLPSVVPLIGGRRPCLRIAEPVPASARTRSAAVGGVKTPMALTGPIFIVQVHSPRPCGDSPYIAFVGCRVETPTPSQPRQRCPPAPRPWLTLRLAPRWGAAPSFRRARGTPAGSGRCTPCGSPL
jgi:hypothetical protein